MRKTPNWCINALNMPMLKSSVWMKDDSKKVCKINLPQQESGHAMRMINTSVNLIVKRWRIFLFISPSVDSDTKWPPGLYTSIHAALSLFNSDVRAMTERSITIFVSVTLTSSKLSCCVANPDKLTTRGAFCVCQNTTNHAQVFCLGFQTHPTQYWNKLT